ncbi:MAG: hypothetical protein J5I94_14685 [Phaeodactylibacter sp.]|nr:hypothetical protein [Phaeodactylibacter sp.]
MSRYCFSAFLLLAALIPAGLSAQFRAGEWLADAEGLYSYSRLGENEQRLYEYGLSGTFHFFPVSRLAMGAGFTTTYLSLDNNFFQAYNLSFFIEPQVRYYLIDSGAPLFLQAGYSWQQTELGRPANSDEKQTAGGNGASAAAGGNLFLAPSVILEGLAGFQYRKRENVVNPSEFFFQRGFYARTGLRILLADDSRPSWWGPGEEPVQASAWMLGGSLEGGLNFRTPNTFRLSVKGGVFPVRRFALGLALELERALIEQSEASGLNSGFEPFLRYYLPLSNSMLAFPTAGFRWGRSEELNSLNLEAFRFRTWQLGMGLNFFVSESSALELVLNLSGREVSPNNAVPVRNFDVSFSLSAGLMTFWY